VGLSIPAIVIPHIPEGHIELHGKSIGVVGSIAPWSGPMLICRRPEVEGAPRGPFDHPDIIPE